MNAKLLSLCSLVCAFDLAVGANSVHGNIQSDACKVVISHIPHHLVESTAIASIGYSRRRHILEIEFLNGAVYRYLEITPSVYRELMTANSKARYYDLNIKGNYCSIRIRPRPGAKP
ncbi:MAG TPA: KTSC domain-containing protein [Chthoniobacterales bacterium]|nr:KTSC domain-containing protein [Chthoniobacterales bacterium]